MKRMSCLLVLAAAGAGAAVCLAAENAAEARPEPTNKIDGYTDTPMLPGGQWHVHDPARPQPKWVPAKYDGEPVPAPAGAEVLFDGKDLSKWKNKDWKLADGAMQVTKGSQTSVQEFGDGHLHVEWMIPETVKGKGQGGGNSGIYVMGRYEVQVLNGWDNRTYADGGVASMYGQKPPDVNPSRKLGQWQCFDIHFKAPVFQGDQLVSPAYLTLYYNNVRVHDSIAYLGQTVWRQVAKYRPHGPKGAISLQAHGSPVCYRNIWLAPLKLELGEKAGKKGAGS